jgi:AMMECR1 domain-containing protein
MASPLHIETQSKSDRKESQTSSGSDRKESQTSSGSDLKQSQTDSKSDQKKSDLDDWFNTLKVEPKFLHPAGVFVTLSKSGKTRACWGSVYPREGNIARETVVATLGALTKEYRFKPVRKSELKDLKIQVTVISSLEAANNVKEINPYKDGVMVRSGGRSGVILPGEATDAYYEFVLARLKAGIQPKDPCQIYKIRADIYD